MQTALKMNSLIVHDKQQMILSSGYSMNHK